MSGQTDVVANLTDQERRFFRDQLRAARTAALLDAEGFHPIILAMEHLGAALKPQGKSLRDFREPLLKIANESSAARLHEGGRGHFVPPETLFEALRTGRNDAVHQGAHARHLVRHCVEFALLLEAGLMVDGRCIADVMVREPISVEPWHQVAYARQLMLINSFSTLPIRVGDKWMLLADYAIAAYLALAGEREKDREKTLRVRIEEASADHKLKLMPAKVVEPTARPQDLARACSPEPMLVVEGGRLLGIATPFDLL